jgi:glycosyltransferase involved in cell wall biosynthesis
VKVVFFARVADPALLDVVDFYRNDITALRELGFEVTTATRYRDIPSGADAYFTWWWGSGALALLHSLPRRRPNVFTGTLQLSPYLTWWQELGTVRRGIVRACVKLASLNVPICKAEQAYVEQLGGRRVQLVYQGIDTSLYCPPAVPTREKLIVTVSHLTRGNAHRKKLGTVIAAIPLVLARHPDARFLMIGGHDDAYPDLLAQAQSLGVQDAISFPGRVSTDEKVQAYQRAALLAQATIYEGFGVSIAEAMACGLPVVTSARGAVTEVVGDCGAFVDPDDAPAMARAICALLDDPIAAQRTGERARARIVERFSYEAHRAGLARAMQTVLPGWTPPAGMA